MPTIQRPLWQRLLSLRLFLVVNVIVLGLLGLSFGREMVRTVEIQRDIASLKNQADELAARNLQMTQLNAAFQTESFVESEARLKLGMKKPGEEVLVIQHPDTPTPTVAGEQTSADAEATQLADASVSADGSSIANPTKWWYYFFDSSRFTQLSSYGER